MIIKRKIKGDNKDNTVLLLLFCLKIMKKSSGGEDFNGTDIVRQKETVASTQLFLCITFH